MKLYYSINSPYARIIRIAIFDADAQDKVDQIEVVTRTPDNPVLAHSPLGRVPTLVTDDLVLGEAAIIYRYLQEQFGNAPDRTDWPTVALESMVIGFLDGLAVWGREPMFHPNGTHSDAVMALEEGRAQRCLAYLEKIWAEWPGEHAWDFAHIALACALVLMARFNGLPDWPKTHPHLAEWFEAAKSRPAMQATAGDFG